MTSLLLNPHAYNPDFDRSTRALLQQTIDWFETRGKRRLLGDYHAKIPNTEFLDFVGGSGLLATFLTPSRDAGGAPDKRWDMSRIVALSEILGFYGMNYLVPWQVTLLGVSPVFQSENSAARARAAAVLEAGGVAAFAVTERAHGADLYSTETCLVSDDVGGFLATGEKYYIGNGNRARTVSVFARMQEDGQYVFFRADSARPRYQVIGNVVPQQIHCTHLRLDRYEVGAEDVLHVGDAALSAVFNTVNVGKFNLSFGGIGMATHAFYEAITHARNRTLYGKSVTDMGHIRTMFVDGYARLVGMRLYCARALDYLRSSGPEDRRYLLFNSVTKMRVGGEAERVVGLLGEIVAARAFESDCFLTTARMDVAGLSRLEGTAAVNLMLIGKFMSAYLFAPEDLPDVPTRRDASDDEFLFRQGAASGLSRVRFQNWRKTYAARSHLANVGLLTEQAEAFTELLGSAAPDEAQMEDMDLLLNLGELFTTIVYGQLILEQADLAEIEDDLVETIFGILVRDFSARCVELAGKRGVNAAQRDWALRAIRTPVVDDARFGRVWAQTVALAGTYEMRP
ncbi:acyl-CoA dehydrogenase family protein [Mycobacterium syngnathidarum]